MRVPTKKAEEFIKAANNGNPQTSQEMEVNAKTEVKKKYQNANSSLNFTENQSRVFRDILSKSNLDSVAHLLGVSVSFAEEEQPFVNTDFSKYLSLLIERGQVFDKVPYRKLGINEIFKERSDLYKQTWINIPIKGVVLMYVLHYAQKKLGIDIEKYLD